MLSFEEYYQEQIAKTSPVHRPAYEYDYSYNYGIQSPISAPVSGFDFKFSNERVADLKEPTSYEDILSTYEKMIHVPPKPKRIVINPKTGKKKTHTFKPFASFEATELTVHQLQSVFNKIAKQKNSKFH